MDEMKFYSAEAVEDLAATIAVGVMDAFKYIYTNYANQANVEDFKYYEDEELRKAFFNLRNDCLEFVTAFDYYNFTCATPYANDGDSFNAIMERTKAYKKHLEENNTTVLTYPTEE